MTDLLCTFCGDHACPDSEGFCCLCCGDPLVACKTCLDAVKAKPVDPKAPREAMVTIAMLRIALELHHWHEGSGRCKATAAPAEKGAEA